MAEPLFQTQLLETLTTAIILVDSELRVSYLNSAAEQLLETSGPRIIGEPVEGLFRETDPSSCSGLSRAVEIGGGVTKRQTGLELANGQQIVVDYFVTPVGEDGCSGYVMEFQPLDRLLQISREEALVSSQQLSQSMVRGLAHEIKNPLGGLRGAAQLLACELPPGHLHDYTNVIIEEADRLRRLVDRMLDAPQRLQPVSLNVHEVTDRVHQLIAAEVAGRIKLVRDYDPSIPEIRADKERLIQATLNIARNACQALRTQDSAELEPCIVFRTRAQRQLTIGNKRHRLVCRIDIVDNGPGIPPELADSLFMPMVSGRPEGTGLGLALAQAILTQHGGVIAQHSEPGMTIFSLFLPIETST